MEPTTPSFPSPQPSASDSPLPIQRAEPTVTESALGIAESWLDALAHVACGVWWITDAEGLVSGEHALSAFTGLAAEALAGPGWLAAFAPTDQPLVRDYWQALATTAPSATLWDTAWRFVRPGARLEWLSVRAQSIATPPGARQRWLWVAGQTTRERAVGAIDLYRSLFEQTAQGLVLVGGPGAPSRANRAALTML